MSPAHDAGLRAVARIREVRERDSRLDVGDARRARADAVTAVAELTRVLSVPVPVTGAGSGFALARTSLLGLSEPLTRARSERAEAEARHEDALARWRDAHARLSAVEGLLERRAAARAVEERRLEARELDDVAGQRREAARRRSDLEEDAS